MRRIISIVVVLAAFAAAGLAALKLPGLIVRDGQAGAPRLALAPGAARSRIVLAAPLPRRAPRRVAPVVIPQFVPVPAAAPVATPVAARPRASQPSRPTPRMR